MGDFQDSQLTLDKKQLSNQLIKDFTNWISRQPDCLAAVLVGSYANHSATAESDIDLVLVTKSPQKYLLEEEWVRQFGVASKMQWEDYGLVRSLRVWYRSGLEVEFGITDARWIAQPLDDGTRKVLSDGFKVLFGEFALR